MRIGSLSSAKEMQILANELQRRAAYSGKDSDKFKAARLAQSLADKMRKEEKRAKREK